MISRFHVYRYANCMLLYNISTLHHRDDGTFSRINFKDASLVGLPAPRHRSLQGNRCAVVPIHKTNIPPVRLRRIVAGFQMSRRCFATARSMLPADDDARRGPRTRVVSYCPCTGGPSRRGSREPGSPQSTTRDCR